MTTRTARPFLVARGRTYRLTRDVDRFPDFVASAGTLVTVTEVGSDSVWARAHRPIPGAGSWDNRIQWTQDLAVSPLTPVARFREDVEPAG